MKREELTVKPQEILAKKNSSPLVSSGSKIAFDETLHLIKNTLFNNLHERESGVSIEKYKHGRLHLPTLFTQRAEN